MPAIGSVHKSIIGVGDATQETSSLTVYNQAVTALTIGSFLTGLAALEAATEDIILGTHRKTQWIGDDTTITNAWPTDPAAQRESKLLVNYWDNTTEKMFQLTIPTIDFSKLVFVPLGGDAVLFEGTDANADIVAWVAAFESFGRSPDDATHRFGADWGFASDPTVLIRCHVVGRTIYVDYEAYRVGCEIMDTPDLFFTIPDSEKWPIVADSARPETISHMRKHGFPKIMPAVKGPKSVEEGVEWLKSYDIVVHPRCQHTIDELTCYSYKTDPLTGQILPILADRDNHLIDALRYACEAIRRAVPPKTFDVQPLATVSRW